jgi:hypothetical protein
MTNRLCVGCGEELAKNGKSREHIRPKRLAQEVQLPEAALRHFLREEEKADVQLRSHGLATFTVKNVCVRCKNGWMSRLESRAKPLLIELMNMRSGLLPSLSAVGSLLR